LLKAVIVSAYGDLDNIRTAMNRGAFDFLTKPIDFQDLEITIQKTYELITELKRAFASTINSWPFIMSSISPRHSTLHPAQ